MSTENTLRSRLLTLFTLLGITAALPNLYFFAESFPLPWYGTIAFLLLCGVTLLLGQRQQYTWAGLVLFIGADSYIFLTAVHFGREAAEQWLYLPVLFGAVLLFNQKSIRALAFIILLTLGYLVILEFTDYELFNRGNVPTTLSDQYKGNVIAAFGLSTVAALFYFHLFAQQKKMYEAKLKLKADSEATINYLATSLHGKNSVDEILWDITQNCVAKLGFTDCVIYLVDQERQVLVQKAAYGAKTTGGTEIATRLEIPIGKGIVGSVASTGVGEIIPDTTLDSRYIVDDEARQSEISVPIFYMGKVFGVIDSEHPRKNFFTLEHLNILTTLAALASNKITKALADEDRVLSAVEKFEAEKIRELDKLKSRFFSNISHEFRTPLTMIMGPLAELIQKTEDEETSRQYMLMQENGQQLLTLINDLLELSRLDEGIMKLNKTTEDINHFIRAIIESLHSQAQSLEIEFRQEISSDILPFSFDMAKMETLLVNILSGLIRLTKRGGSIIVTTIHSDGKYTLRIDQHGSTLPAHTFDKVIDTNASPADVERYEGTGIGMSLAAQLIALHEGTFNRVTVNESNRFTISFPITHAPLEVPAIDAPTGSPEPTPKAILDTSTTARKPTVLLVEDNNDLRRYLRKVLESDFQITEADNGATGWKLASTEIPDLVISDVMMPIRDGFEMCLDIKSHEVTNHIPVILLTAKADLESRIEGLKTGADYYLSKPFEPRELLSAATNLIEQRKRLRDHFSKKLLLQPKEWQGASADERFLSRLMDLVEKNIPEPAFSVDDLVREMGISRMQLHRKLKALTDQSATEFIRTVRLKRAAEMLQKGHDNVSQVAYQVGFSSLSYFTKCFKEQYGLLPSEMNVRTSDNS